MDENTQTTADEWARLRSLGWSPQAIVRELERQGRPSGEIAALVLWSHGRSPWDWHARKTWR